MSKDNENVPKQNIVPIVDEELTLDAILTQLGSLGRYQKVLFVLMMPFAYFFAFLYFVQLFVVATPENYWCKIPELSHLSLELRRNLSAPGAGTKNVEKCLTYDVNWTQIAKSMTPPPPSTPKVPCKQGWDFELSDIPYETVVTERGWVCADSSNVPLAQAAFFVGAIVGSVFMGWFADYFGRVPALVGLCFIGGLGGITTTFTSGKWDFMFCRFLTGLSFDNIFYMMYILALEYVGPAHRTCVANLSVALFFGSGCYVLLGLTLLLKDWRILLWVTSVPMLFGMLTYFILPESIRWHLTKGEVTKAVEIIRRFERINKRTVPDDVLNDFIEAYNRKEKSTESFLDLLRSIPLRFTVLFMLVVYMSCSLSYDVLVRLSDAFGMNLFITFALMSATELPSLILLILLLDRAGRKLHTFVTLLATGALVFVAMFLSKGMAQLILATLARFSVNMAWNGVAQWSTELLPTTVRATGSSGLHLSGHVISVLSPYIAYSESLWSGLPLLIISITTVVGAVVCRLLPETSGLAMPQNMAEGEKIIVQNTMWGAKFEERRNRALVVIKPQDDAAVRRDSENNAEK